MKRETIRNATNAHGWIGLIISVPLFIVFWAGSVTLFLPEVSRWATLPHMPMAKTDKLPSLNQVIENSIAKYDYDTARQFYLRTPSDYSPYLTLSVPVYDSPEKSQLAKKYQNAIKERLANGEALSDIQQDLKAPSRSKTWKYLQIDPSTHQVLAEESQFEMAHFINELHYNFHLPQGDYIVGFVTFFFLVIIFTGIVIQLKKMIANFFLYRHDRSNRYKMLDLHNVVGVISLPFAMMYAVTGLMFNLGVLFQAPAVYMLYDGDRQAMTIDAGYGRLSQQPSYQYAQMPNLNELAAHVSTQDNITFTGMNIQNWGDESAVIRVIGIKKGTFSERLSLYYSVEQDGFPNEYNPQETNIYAKGNSVMFQMHMVDYGEIDLRFIYFLLGIGVCAMIVAGNALWIVKRLNKRDNAITIKVLTGSTLGGCIGVVVATSFAFLLERTLPVELTERGHWLEAGFFVALFAFILLGFIAKSIKLFIHRGMLITASILTSIVIYDLFFMREQLIELWQVGFKEPSLVTLSLALIAMLFYLLSKKFNIRHTLVESTISTNPPPPLTRHV